MYIINTTIPTTATTTATAATTTTNSIAASALTSRTTVHLRSDDGVPKTLIAQARLYRVLVGA